MHVADGTVIVMLATAKSYRADGPRNVCLHGRLSTMDRAPILEAVTLIAVAGVALYVMFGPS